jgi:hypothetical protein
MPPLLCEQALKMKTLRTIDAIDIPDKNSCLHSLVGITSKAFLGIDHLDIFLA